ncbi:MAG: GNAT family N-acetyltransferase [Firmicutes bacterium]|nr:GNAT family N-acetyltransferase [Bacillota bacterium]
MNSEQNVFRLETERLVITEFTMDMATDVHLNSLDEDNRRFVPDEVFETVEDAAETIEFLKGFYDSEEGPFVYPILKKDGTYLGHVQAVPMDDGEYEIGYHIGGSHTGKGYATEAVKGFLPVIMERLGLSEMLGICLKENAASARVMEKADFVKTYEGPGNYQDAEREICKFVFRK